MGLLGLLSKVVGGDFELQGKREQWGHCIRKMEPLKKQQRSATKKEPPGYQDNPNPGYSASHGSVKSVNFGVGW